MQPFAKHPMAFRVSRTWFTLPNPMTSRTRLRNLCRTSFDECTICTCFGGAPEGDEPMVQIVDWKRAQLPSVGKGNKDQRGLFKIIIWAKKMAKQMGQNVAQKRRKNASPLANDFPNVGSDRICARPLRKEAHRTASRESNPLPT